PWVDQRVRGLDDARLRRPEKPGKWSVLEVLQHLADTDLVYGYRLRMILTNDTPPIPGYDQDVWAREFHYRELPLAEPLAKLAALRAANLRLYRSLGPDQRKRAGLHSERGPESVEHILRMVGAHDLVHRRQIERILATLCSSSGSRAAPVPPGPDVCCCPTVRCALLRSCRSART